MLSADQTIVASGGLLGARSSTLSNGDSNTVPNAKAGGVPERLEPIAVVGMAMRLPGEVHNGEQLWSMLMDKRSGICEVPEDRYNVAGFHDPAGIPGTWKSNKGFFLRDVDIRQFDASFFSMSKPELKNLDPIQRQLLEVAYECMEDAGATSWRGSNIGCYVAAFSDDWRDLNAKETQHRGNSSVLGYDDMAISNRVSYEFDLHGPSMTIKTGCSSSLVCLDLACDAIRKGDCAGALVCGSNLIFSPTLTLTLTNQGMLSPTGTCKTFDASADGYARGEAVNVVYIKKLSQALRDGDAIRAVIRGTGVNCDGRTQGILTPSPEAQEALIRRTYQRAGISDLSETAIVECHGTGTPAGDPRETLAVGKCFGDKGMIITSVKPNVGHSEGAAGLTSLIKAILAIEHRQVPPNIYFKTPNPSIPFKRYNLRVPVEVQEWPQGRAERISVNSFGVGGVNAHAIVESLAQYQKCYPDFGRDATARVNGIGVNGNGATHHSEQNDYGTHINGNGYTHKASKYMNGAQQTNGAGDMTATAQSQLLLLSSNNETSLAQTIEAYNDFVMNSTADLNDVAFTLANRRDHMPCRAYAIAKAGVSFEASTSSPVKSSPTIGWVFTGQGAQWPEMGAELIDHSAVFRRSIRNLDRFLLGLPQPPSWSIEDELRKARGPSRVEKAEFGHPLCVAVQIGLVDLLRSWNIRPDFVVGHSSGEMGAAYGCGALTAEAAMAAAFFRGATSKGGSSDRRGSMAAIGLGRHEMAPYMEPGVVIACENSQSSVTVSGDSEQVQAVIKNVKKQRAGVLARMLRVEKAFHSHHMLEYGPSYERAVRPYAYTSPPEIPFFSSVTGERLSEDMALGPEYWRRNMESPVLFNQAVRSALAGRNNRALLIEIGPHPTLKGPIAQILRDLGRKDDLQLATLQREKDAETSVYHLAGGLFQQDLLPSSNLPIFPPGKSVHTLPRRFWDRDISNMVESRVSSEWRFRKEIPHELLGSRVTEISGELCWRNRLLLQDVPWLLGHEIGGQILFPATGFMAMIGEAIRQLHGTSSFTLRNVAIKAGLVLEHDRAAELVTTLTLSSAGSDQPPSYEFAITSFDGNKWVKNCFGEVIPSTAESMPLDGLESGPLPRKVDPDNWYSVMKGLGGHYSGIFRGVRDISASPTKQLSVATASAVEADARKKYAIHPASLDQCIQCCTVAAYHGLGRDYRNFAVPTFIEEVSISPSLSDITVTTNAYRFDRGSSVCDAVGRDEKGQVVMYLKGLKVTAIGDDSSENGTRIVSQFEWRPHADFSQLSELVYSDANVSRYWASVEDLVLLCCLDHTETIKLRDDAPPHSVRLLSWMKNSVDQYRAGSNGLVTENLELAWSLPGERRLTKIREMIASLSGTRWATVATAVERIFEGAEALFAGDAAHSLNELERSNDSLLTMLYNSVYALECDRLIQAISHTNPRLRVLQIGTGTNEATAKILDTLTSPQGERMYGSYVITDVSAASLSPAKERFADVENLEYAVLDLASDIAEQGFEEGGYDFIIIGPNVFHATPNMRASLRNLGRLLCPGGKLFLSAISPETKVINYLMGFFPGWWASSEDDQAEEPTLSAERWSEEMTQAGFKVLDIAGTPSQGSIGIIASPDSKVDGPSTVTLLCHSPDGLYYNEIKTHLESQHINVDTCLFGQPLPPNDVISLLDLQTPVLHELAEESFKTLVGYVVSLGSKLIWAMPSCQVACNDPRPAMTLGFARTARNELSVELYTVEIDSDTGASRAANILHEILLHTQKPESKTNEMDPDWEYAVIGGQVHVPRIHWKTFPDAFSESYYEEEKTTSIKQLTLERPGSLHTMKWAEMDSQPPRDNEVIVETKALALNSRDVLIAFGHLENGRHEIGSEGCGVIAAVGPSVKGLGVGDRVAYFSPGRFGTEVTVKESLCVRVPDSMSFEQSAGVPCAYATAIIALMDKANLQEGQTVLIHSACSSVGLAALQIAQMLGSEIFCTVGNDDKVDYLTEHHGIPRSRIFNSRDSSFLRDILKATDKKGVEVVLNSLSGDLLNVSWRCVSEFGVMVDISKRDSKRRTKLSSEAFEQNRTLVGLDVFQMAQQQPERVSRALRRAVSLIEAGSVKPVEIARIWEAGETQDAFRSMQPGRHIGKNIIRMPRDASALPSDKATPLPPMRADRSYLLVGGLGGLGRSVATWMVEHGARHLIFMSRSAIVNAETNDYLEELSAQDCHVQLVQGSVSEIADVERVVRGSNMPIAGVINFSMVLRDVGIEEMSFDDWQTAVAPKVQGTWNLHNAITDELDFFILCSSYSGIIGQWGQSNYAAANAFLDAFAQYRHRLGLAASVIDIGAMAEVGVVAKNKILMDRFEKSGIFLAKERDLLSAMNLAIQRSAPTPPVQNGAWMSANEIILGLATEIPFSSPQNRVAWKSDMRMSIYHNINNSGDQSSMNAGDGPANRDAARSLMNEAASRPEILALEETTVAIAKAVASAVCKFLMKEDDSVDVKASPDSIGVDSLVAMELRTWVRQSFGVEMTVVSIIQGGTLLKLGDQIRQRLVERFPMSA